MFVTKRDNSLEKIDLDKINKAVERACVGLEDVSISEVVLDAHLQMYDKITTKEIDKALILSARSKIEKEPNYSYVAARLLLTVLYKEAFGRSILTQDLEKIYKESFVKNTIELVKLNRLNPKLLELYDLEELAKYLNVKRDLKFKYLGLCTLYDRYFIHVNSVRKETPQAFFMRIAMGICLKEKDPMKWAKEFYDLYSEFLFMPSTPTLFNSGTLFSQLSSCFLSTFGDSLDGIFGGLHDQARLSKYAGGLSVDVTNLRATNSHIEGTNGKSTGIVPWLKLINDMTLAVNQGGKRPGVCTTHLEPWHLDVEEYLQIKRSTGDDRRRAHELHTALWIPDLFMEYVEQDKDWYLFCPHECKDLHSSYGKDFNLLYLSYIEKSRKAEIKNYKIIKAKELWKKILKEKDETGYPFLNWKDVSNIKYPNKHEGVVNCSNLCQEIIEHTKSAIYNEGVKIEPGEIATCDLGSVNLLAHADSLGRLDIVKLAKSTRLGIRHLDNVIDNNYYPVKDAEISSKKHRHIGLGRMGFQDLLHLRNVPYDSDEAVRLSEYIAEMMAYNALAASSALAKERGKYLTYEGSEWSKGKLLQDLDNDYLNYKNKRSIHNEHLSWTLVRKRIKKYGLRNANLLATAPTATISNIVGCSPCIDPSYSMLHVVSNLSGEFTIINENFVKQLKKLNLWNDEFRYLLKLADGDISNLDLPENIKNTFKSVFNMNFYKVIDCNIAASKWIDQAQSFNIYYSGSSLKEISELYMYCWKKGLKTTYYFKTKAASKIEKTCSLDNKSCESCQ